MGYKAAPVYPGLEHRLAYQFHVDHMTVQLAKALPSDQWEAAQKRVDQAVANGHMTRVQALAHEIKRAVNSW